MLGLFFSGFSPSFMSDPTGTKTTSGPQKTGDKNRKKEKKKRTNMGDLGHHVRDTYAKFRPKNRKNGVRNPKYIYIFLICPVKHPVAKFSQ